jgi:hypothetical protein
VLRRERDAVNGRWRRVLHPEKRWRARNVRAHLQLLLGTHDQRQLA